MRQIHWPAKGFALDVAYLTVLVSSQLEGSQYLARPTVSDVGVVAHLIIISRKLYITYIHY